MKKLINQSIFSVFLVAYIFTGCSEGSDYETRSVLKAELDTLTFEPSMKGWELYSWPDGDTWNYSVLPGTNRIKSYKEVTTNHIIVSGTDLLKLMLDKLPENENIFWIGREWLEQCWGGNYGNLSLPDPLTVTIIKEYCADINLVLSITD